MLLLVRTYGEKIRRKMILYPEKRKEKEEARSKEKMMSRATPGHLPFLQPERAAASLGFMLCFIRSCAVPSRALLREVRQRYVEKQPRNVSYSGTAIRLTTLLQRLVQRDIHRYKYT